MKRIFFTLLLSFIVAVPAYAVQRGQATMTWLGIASSARDEAIGGTATLGDADAGCAFTNPAGLGRISRGSAFASYTSWIADMAVADIAVAYHVRNIGAFALAFRSMDYGSFTFTQVALNSQGYILTPEDKTGDVAGTMMGLAYGRALTDKFAVGGQVKYVTDVLGTMDTFDATTSTLTENDEAELDAVLFDFGTSYDTGWKGVVISMTIQNFGASQKASNGVEEFTPPLTFKVGLAANVLKFAGIETDMADLTVRTEGVDPRDDREGFNVGGELKLMPMEAGFVALRGGYSRRDAGGLSLGCGVGTTLAGFTGRFDYAYSDYGNILGGVNRFGLTLAF